MFQNYLCLLALLMATPVAWAQDDCQYQDTYDVCDMCTLCGTTGQDTWPPRCVRCNAYLECLMACPLIIDMNNDGFQFGGKQNSVWFDLYADDNPIKLQWVFKNQDDAFLVMDLNDDGRVADGSELFGNGTEMITSGEKARNGFVALAQYDTALLGGNDDGFIDAADGIWDYLYLWTDRNSNGHSEPGEWASVSASGLTRLGTIPTENLKTTDRFNNWLRFWSTATKQRNGKTTVLNLIDVYLRKSKERPGGNG